MHEAQGDAIVLLNQNLTLKMPPGWERQTQLDFVFYKTDTSIAMVVRRKKEKYPRDLAIYSSYVINELYENDVLGLYGQSYQVIPCDSLVLEDGQEIRLLKYVFPNKEMNITGKPQGPFSIWYYYTYDGVSGYSFGIAGGAKELSAAREEIEGMITSSVLGIRLEDLKLGMFLLPQWGVLEKETNRVSFTGPIETTDTCTLTIIKANDGAAADRIDLYDPESVAATAGDVVRSLMSLDVLFSPSHTVKFADGVEAQSALAQVTRQGIREELWFIFVQTANQGTYLLFEGPLGFVENDRSSLDPFLASIELFEP